MLEQSEINCNWYVHAGGKGTACRGMVQKSERNTELEKPRHRWENIKVNLKRNTRRDVECVSVNWDRDQYRFFLRR